MDIELERLEKLEEKYGIEIHVESNVETKMNRYFYRKNKDKKFVYVTHNIDMLEKYFRDRKEGGVL